MTSDSSKNGGRLLDGIRGPDDIKAIREQDLPQLAQEVRNKLIEVLSQTGGHLGPNLGVVELTIALHRVFNTPKDRLVFDVSHQGYVHKMFTGRLDRIHTMTMNSPATSMFNSLNASRYSRYCRVMRSIEMS